jgi:hypothetical protein
MPKKIALFFNGTWASHKRENDLPESKSGKVHSTFAWVAYQLMGRTNNIVELHKHCSLPLGDKFILEGPGTAILDAKQSDYLGLVAAARSISALFYAGLDIESNLDLAKKFLLDKAQEAKKLNEPLEIHLFGWSRGSFSIFLLKNYFFALEDQGYPIKKVYIHNMDPVPGTLLDRVDLHLHTPKHTAIKFEITTYFSDSGNLDFWQSIPGLTKINTPCFSGLRDKGKEYIFTEATHEDIVGISNHQITHTDPQKKHKACIGLMVLANIALHATQQKLPFQIAWLTSISKLGIEALAMYSSNIKENKLSPAPLRKYLTSTSPWFGTEESSENTLLNFDEASSCLSQAMLSDTEASPYNVSLQHEIRDLQIHFDDQPTSHHKVIDSKEEAQNQSVGVESISSSRFYM